MDSASIAADIAAYLKGRDDIATAEPFNNDPECVNVKTQGGKLYTLCVNDDGMVTTETAAPE